MLEVNESFRILRVRVEDQAPIPSVVVVSSALRGDGASYVATGLARAFAEFRHRTLLIDAHGGDAGAIEELDGLTAPRLSVRAMFGEDASENVAKTLAGLRGEYDVVVIDAPPLPQSSLALALARASDGVILAVRLGRRKSQADSEMMRLLSERRILGVVTTNRPSRPGTTVGGFLPQPLAEAGERLRAQLVRVVAPALRAVRVRR
jgi:Mrp family chromosome partitioning ATPase